MEPNPHPLGGVRPCHTPWASCGDPHGGLEIKGGVIVCPECGAAVNFDLPRPERAHTASPPGVTLSLLLSIALVMALPYALQ